MQKLDDYIFKKIENNQVLFISTILFLNYFIKTIFLSVPSIWYDEAFSIFNSQDTISHILNVSIRDQNPPFYNIILKYWISIFGISTFAVRFLSVLFSLLSVPLIYLFAKKYINIRAAVMASILYLIWNDEIYYSMEARSYTLVSLLVLVSLHLYFILLNATKRKAVFSTLLGITNVLLLFTHYLTIFYLITQFIFFVLIHLKDKKFRNYYILSIIVSMLCFTPWLFKIIDIIGQTGNGHYWLKAATLNDFNDLVYRLFNNYLTFISLVIISIIGTSILIKKKEDTSKLLLFFLLAFLPIFISYFASNIIPVFLERYLLYTILGYIFLVSTILSKSTINIYFRYFSFIFFVIILIYKIDLKQQKNQDYKAATEYIKSEVDNNTLIIIAPRALSLPFSYYYNQAAFSNVEYHEWELMKDNVLLVEDKNELNRINLNAYNKIILLRSFANYHDVNNTILDSITSKLDLYKANYNFRDATVYIFNNKNFHSYITDIIPNYFEYENILINIPFNISDEDSYSLNNSLKISKGIKYGMNLTYNITDDSVPLKSYSISFQSKLLSEESSVLLNLKYIDITGQILLDSNISFNKSLNKALWESNNFILNNIKPDVKCVRIEFVNELENTSMFIDDLKFESKKQIISY